MKRSETQKCLVVSFLFFIVMFCAYRWWEQSKTQWWYKPGYKKSVSDHKAAHLHDIAQYPFGIGVGFYCDTPPYPDWHYCYTPEVIRKELIRRMVSKMGECKKDDKSNMVLHYLKQFPYSCNEERLPGYTEAIERKYTPVLVAMRKRQGKDIPELSDEQFLRCKLERASKATGENMPVDDEIAIRRCAYSFSKNM